MGSMDGKFLRGNIRGKRGLVKLTQQDSCGRQGNQKSPWGDGGG